jgi:hypothetical protein
MCPIGYGVSSGCGAATVSSSESTKTGRLGTVAADVYYRTGEPHRRGHRDILSVGSGALIGFRQRFHALCWRRADALFELTDAMLCAQGPVRSPVELSLGPEFHRGHGSVYDALTEGRIDAGGLRRLLLGASSPAGVGEPLMFAIDVTPNARPDPEYADERVMVQVRGKGGDKFLPGWPYSLLVGMQWGCAARK